MVIWDPVPSLGHKYCLIVRKPGASMLHPGMKNSCDDFCARAGQGSPRPALFLEVLLLLQADTVKVFFVQQVFYAWCKSGKAIQCHDLISSSRVSVGPLA